MFTSMKEFTKQFKLNIDNFGKFPYVPKGLSYEGAFIAKKYYFMWKFSSIYCFADE